MSKRKKKNVHVFFSCDDNYVPFLAVSLESIKAHASSDNFYTIKVLHAGSLNLENQQKILDRYSKGNIFVEFVDIAGYIERLEDVLHTRDYYSKTIYFRLFIPNLYSNYDKALYIDCDTVLLDDIANLYNIDLGNNYVGAIPDEAVSKVPEFMLYVKKRLRLPSAKRYFNSGILLMNLKKLREIDFENLFIEMIKKVRFDAAPDQDYLNTICKGKVRYIGLEWNKMPMPDGDILERDIKLVHYNLDFKPWKRDNILYEKYFWHYARRSPYAREIAQIKKENSSKDIAKISEAQTESLKALCIRQAVDDTFNLETYKIVDEIMANAIKEPEIQKAPDRLEVLEKIEEYERFGLFDKEVENDPPSKELLPKKIDYLNKKMFSKVNSFIAYWLAKRYLKRLKRDKVLVIKDFIGIENFQNLRSGAIITCNHFNALDSFAMEECYFKSRQKNRGRKFYRVIREGNYTSFPGLFGFLMRHCHTLPLSSNHETMRKFLKAIDTVLQRGDFILIYPEQSMWWNYRKPKPLKKSAYKFAIKNDVPVLPIFITMEDSDRIGEDGFPIQEYTMHISKPIYADPNKSMAENAEEMKNKNYELWKEIYEDVYNEKLVYTTEQQEEVLGGGDLL